MLVPWFWVWSDFMHPIDDFLSPNSLFKPSSCFFPLDRVKVTRVQWIIPRRVPHFNVQLKIV